MKKIIATVAVIATLGLATSAHAVKHTGPTKKTVYSYNNSHTTPPKPDQEISRSEPSKPPIITIRVEWDGKCLRAVYPENGVVVWEFCL